MTTTKTKKKETTKKTVVKKEEKNKEEKQTLIELVSSSTIKPSKITLELSRAGLLKQLEYEMNTNEYVEPLLTQKEFDKIMNGGEI